MPTYKIVRFYFGGKSTTIRKGLTLEEVQEHCEDPEGSSRTCKSKKGKDRTKKNGMWFEGFTEEK